MKRKTEWDGGDGIGKEKERCAGVTVKGESTHALVNTTAMYVCEWQSVAYNHHTPVHPMAKSLHCEAGHVMLVTSEISKTHNTEYTKPKCTGAQGSRHCTAQCTHILLCQ